MIRPRLLLGMILGVLAMPAAAQERAADKLTLFAAASLKNALDDVNSAFTKASGIKTVASYASSGALIKQIEAGAPADVFISADRDWMDYGVKAKAIDAGTRFDLLGNTLVLVAPRDSTLERVDIGPGFDIAALAGDGRIAIGDVRAVPAGLYAKAALQTLGAWAKAEPKLAMSENVRAALTLVARGETPLGIVYATDAKAEPQVKVVGTFPADSHPPIVYPAAATAQAAPAKGRYLAFLRGGTAQVIFERFGFTFLVKAGP